MPSKKTDMQRLGETIADEWFQEILTYFCKQTGDSVEDVLKMLIEINEQIVKDYCEQNFDMIDRENAVEEVQNQGFTVSD